VFIKNPKIRRKRRKSRTKIAENAQKVLLYRDHYTRINTSSNNINKYELWIYKTCKRIWSLPSRRKRSSRPDLLWEFYTDFRCTLFPLYDPSRAEFSIYVDHVASKWFGAKITKEKKRGELDEYSYLLEFIPDEHQRYSPPIGFLEYVSKQDLPWEILNPCLRFLSYYIEKKTGPKRQQPPVRNANREVVVTTITRLWREYEKGR
jgi:hypothetical protein